MASALLCGFVGANVFAWVCVAAMPATASDAVAMPGCDMEMMEMPDAEGITVRASGDCCLNCFAEAGLLDTPGFELPLADSAPAVLDGGARELVLPASGARSAPVRPPETSPPVLLLTGSLLL